MTSEAERLAQALEWWNPNGFEPVLFEAAKELRRLSAENPVLQDCVESLTETVKDKEAEIARLLEIRERLTQALTPAMWTQAHHEAWDGAPNWPMRFKRLLELKG